MATIFLNGLVKDYNPPGGINAATLLQFDPVSQDWAAGKSFACPQGFLGADVISHTTCHTMGIVSDTGVPVTGVDRGAWNGGTTYNKYDKTIDPFDSLQYVTLVQGPTLGVQPHSSGQWRRTSWNGCGPRSTDAGFYGAVRATGDASRWFTCEVHARGVSGGSEPTFTGTGFDGTAFITRLIVYKGDWTGSTNYNNGDYVRADGSFWKVIGGGISDPTPPNFTGTFYGNACSDTNNLYRRDYIDAGLWAASTTYGFKVVTGKTITQGGTDVRSQALRGTNGTSLCVFNNAAGTDGVTGGSEPAWSAAGPGSFWEDNTIIWRFGTFAVGDPTLQNERLCLTGFAAATNGKQITVQNVSPNGTKRDVNLIDKAGLCGGGDQAVLSGTDKVSIAGFNFLGFNYALAEGQSVIVQYNSSPGEWVFAGVPGGGGGSLRTILDAGT